MPFLKTNVKKMVIDSYFAKSCLFIFLKKLNCIKYILAYVKRPYAFYPLRNLTKENKANYKRTLWKLMQVSLISWLKWMFLYKVYAGVLACLKIPCWPWTLTTIWLGNMLGTH